MPRRMITLALAGVLAAGISTGLATPALGYVEVPVAAENVYLYSDYYFGLNGVGGPWDALANCTELAQDLSRSGAHVATCTRTAYGARLDVYQRV
jgi:hypothetical protein